MISTSTKIINTPQINDLLWAISHEFNEAKHQIYTACIEKDKPFQGNGGELQQLNAKGWNDGWAKSIYAEVTGAAKARKETFELDLEQTQIKLKQTTKRRSQTQKTKKLSNKDKKSALHKQNVRIGYLEAKILRMENLQKEIDKGKNHYPLVFGSKKLFNAQHYLEANKYKNFAQWQCDWFIARHHTFSVVGKRHTSLSNTELRLHLSSAGDFLELKVPKFLRHLNNGSDWLHIPLAKVKHYREHLMIATSRSGKISTAPVSARLFYNEDKDCWYSTFTCERVAAPPVNTIQPYRGALGIDINPDHLDVGIINKEGNKIWQQKFPIKLNGNTKQNQTEIGITVAKIIAIAQWLQIPVASEKLNFDMKKQELRYLPGKQAKKLSSFAYNSIMQHIQGRCIESGTEHKVVNPAWTSFLAQINYAAQYGISVDQGAACVIARRSLGFRERVNSRASKVGPERSTFGPNRRGRNNYYRTLAKKVLPLKRANTYGLEFLNRGSPKTLSSSTELRSSVESDNLLGGRRSSPNRRHNHCGVNTMLLLPS